MRITLPAVDRKEVDGRIVTTRREIPVDIDTSFLAHLKWEEQFQATLGCDLSTYAERARKWLDDPSLAKANFLGCLKILYCYVSSSELPTFRDFCKLFDVSVGEEICKKLLVVFDEINHTVSKN